MTKISISPATEQDIPALDKLVNSAYRGESSKKGWTTEADLIDGQRTNEYGLREMLQTPHATILKYEESGKLLGCVYLEKKGTELYLGMLTVSPDAQTGGIGKQLMAAAEKHAIELHCTAITMTVITVRHELIAWYKRRGYQPTGERIPFPNNPNLGILKQPLEFMVMKKGLA
ncbi:GNAT family N-acetyltransferase [Spirosoma litoris]